MMATREEIEESYTTRLQEMEDQDAQAELELIWLWYCKERYALDGLPEIFRLCQRTPKQNGLNIIWSYAREGVTDRELYNALRLDTADLYVWNLLRAAVLATDIRADAAYLSLAKEVVLEGVKACRPLCGAVLSLDPAACTVAEAAATIWLRFVDQIHSMARLTCVSGLTDVMDCISPEERALVKSNDFAGYALSDLERAELERDLDLSAVPGP